jgi:signal transduction histidine kinase
MPEATFPVPDDEAARLESLARYGIVGAPPPPDLPSVVELAAYLCDVPNAVVNIISEHQQVQIATVGFEPGVCARGDSMCATTIVEPVPVHVTDARLDPRFADNPHVTGILDDIRFYAGSQLKAPDGHVLGTLCVFDRAVHDLSTDQREGLDKLARMVVDVLELHRHSRLLHDALLKVERTSGELVRSNTALKHFAGQVSHDLKNPLTGVLGFVASLADIPAVTAEPDAKMCIDRALSSATRMWRMIEDVLAHASVGATPQLRPVSLGEIAGQVIEDLNPAINAANATVTIEPLPTVVGDATQLRVLLQNLVNNAVKFRDRSRPCRVTISGDAGVEQATLRVADNGVGIPPADRDRVLEMFTRLRTDVEGSGIGLATCQRIIEAHHATLTIGETPGGGTTMTVAVPIGADAPVLVPA